MGLLSSWMKWSIKQGFEKSNIERHKGNSSKRDMMGEAGCEKNYGGYCFDCNLRYGCSRYII